MRRVFAPLCGLALLALAANAQDGRPVHDPGEDFLLVSSEEPGEGPLAADLAAIEAEALAAHVRLLAAPSMAGRGLGNQGLEAATEYVAAALASAGIRPLATGGADDPSRPSYFQPIPLRELADPGGTLTIAVRQGDSRTSRAFESGVDCLLPALPGRSITAPVVFAGYGIREPELGRDDYRSLDVRGTIVLLLGGLPPGERWRTEELEQRYDSRRSGERWAARVETASALGAVAVLATEDRDWPAAVAADEVTGRRVFLPFGGPGYEAEPPVLVRVSPAVAHELLGALHEADPGVPRRLPGATATIEMGGRERLVIGRNVIGWLPGSDPTLEHEAVVIGAHVDHLGTSAGVIYPGADDNASGVAAVLEIARALAASERRLRRSVVFAFWTGEEEGKLGSGFFVHHPLWPLERTVAYINLDMIGHPWSADEIRALVADAGLEDGDEFLARVRTAQFAEPGLAEWAPELAEALRQAGRVAGMSLHLDRGDGLHGGSDYRDFARRHVPWIRFFGNFFPAYHEPGDTAESLDVGQVQRMARFCLATIVILADR